MPMLLTSLASGTSPRMRGKPAALVQLQTAKRNIPAYAGKTRRINVIWPSLTEHPRVCGENIAKYTELNTPKGTSPRMRGKLTNT